MLFDLRARGRRRTVQAIYIWLAILMGGGLILFGIGGATAGGLLDAFKGGGSSGGASDTVKKAEQRVQKHPADPAAWKALTRARYLVVTSGQDYNQQTGTFTPQAKPDLRKVAAAWDGYLGANPTPPDPTLARQMVIVFGAHALDEPAKALRALDIVGQAQGQTPNANYWYQYAVTAYAAGNTRQGDLGAQKALSLAPKSRRKQYQNALTAAKKSPQQAWQQTS